MPNKSKLFFRCACTVRKNSFDLFDRAKPVTEPERSAGEALRGQEKGTLSPLQVMRQRARSQESKVPTAKRQRAFKVFPAPLLPRRTRRRRPLSSPSRPVNVPTILASHSVTLQEAPASPSSRAKHPHLLPEGTIPTGRRCPRKSLPSRRSYAVQGPTSRKLSAAALAPD